MNNETGKLSFDKLLLLSSVFALFYTFCLYRNKMGLTFPLFALGTAALFLYYLRLSGRALKRGSALYLAGIALLGLNVCLTSNEIVILFDKGFIFLLFFMLFLHNLYDVATWDLSKYALSLSAMMLSTVQFLPRPVKDLGAYLNIRTGERSKNRAPAETAGGQMKSVVFYVMVGLGISVPLLAVILPLLLSSDVIFMEFFEGVFDFDIGDDLGAILFMVVSVFVASYGMLCRFGQPMKYAATPVTDKRTHSPVIAITVNLVLLVVYLAYCGIQVVYLFLRRGTLPEGYTYSSYAHEGFFQLVFVCMINILIVLICRKYSADSAALKSVLCLISACTYVLIASAAYRMFLYIGAYKLTFLRLYVLWALAVMAVVMAGGIVYLFRPGMQFARFAAGVLVGLWIVFAYAKPDYLIAAYNIQNHDDDSYILQLSYDAVPAIEKYDASGKLLADYFEFGSYSIFDENLEGDAPRGRKASLRTWNYSQQRTYRIYDGYRERQRSSF
jgi:hypothetical protein